MAARQPMREESWASVHRSEASQDESDDDAVSMEDQDDQPLMTVGDVQRVIHPLQATADRVGKQVEKFAETLDRLGAKRDRRAVDCQDVLPLVYEYERIASETVKRLKRHHDPERQEALKKKWQKRLQKSSDQTLEEEQNNDASDPNATTVADLEHWEEEQQTWQLLRLILQLDYPSKGDVEAISEPEERFRRPKSTAEIHQFSSEREVWNAFLEQDDKMWEKYLVVEWLKSSANSSGQDIDMVVQQLESGAERGEGLWAHSWLYTKEAIKGQKRLRSWPQPLETTVPGIDTALVTSDKSQPLVTQLDPDAFSRQGRELMAEDVFFERATWLACYEMIRRGHSWDAIRDWCQERVEVWRALSMRGDPRLTHGGSDSKDVLSGWQARTIWRKMCSTLSREGGIDEYENAVYGILSGDFPSVEKVVRGWDDYLFATYNSQLLQGFDFYTRQKFANSLPWEVLDKFGKARFDKASTQPEFTGDDAWAELLDHEITKDEANTPIKMLQGSIIAKRMSAYLSEQGRRLGQTVSGQDRRNLINTHESQSSPTADLKPEHYDMLRVLTHVAFLLQALGAAPAEGDAIENLVIAYIDYLGKAGKQQLLPLYASRLSYENAVNCMAGQLSSIVDTNERRIVLRLMQQYGLDVSKILLLQLDHVAQLIPSQQLSESTLPPVRLLIQPHNKLVLPIIDSEFMGEECSDDEEDLIRGMEWFLLLEGHWNETMTAGSFVYKHFFSTGSLAAARQLCQRVPFSTISTSKTKDILGRTEDLSMFSDEEESERRHRRTESQAQINMKKDYLVSSSQTFRDFESLVMALDAIERWKAYADDLSAQSDPRHAKEMKIDFQKAYEEVVTYVEPIIGGDWLQNPIDDKEAAELKRLRRQYLPELLIAYNTVLSISGQFLSREILLKSMELAALVAMSNSELVACVIEAKRMSELVDAFGMSSRTILRADEMGIRGTKKGRRGHQAEGLGIWTVHRPEILKQFEKA